MQGTNFGKLTRPLAVWLLGLLLVGMSLPLVAKADGMDDCLKDITVKVNGQEETVQYAKAYPEVCAAICYNELSPDKKVEQLTPACKKCELIAASTALSIFPDKAKLVGTAIGAYTAAFCLKYLAEGTVQAGKEALCDKGPLGCCIENYKDGTDGKGKIDVETCYKKPPVYYGDCYCIVDKAVVPPDENKRGRSTFPACEVECNKKNGRVDVTQGIGRYKAESVGAPELESDINVLCWKPDDCGLANGNFSGMESACPTGQGYCLAPEPAITMSSPILGQMQVKGIRGYSELMLRFMTMAAMLASAIMFVYGGFEYILGASFAKIASAKKTLANSLVGLVLSLSSVLLLNTMNPATSNFSQLGIKMINNVKFTTFNWCTDFKPVNKNKPLMFGDSGDPPGQFLYSEAKMETKAEDTQCGKEYYIDGYTGQRCDGNKCEEKGKTCFPCKSGIEECGDKKYGYACVKGTVAGYVTYADGRIPKNIQLLAVCGYIQSNPDEHHGWPKVAANIPDNFKASISSGSGDAGGAAYIYSGGMNDLKKMQDDCAKVAPGNGLRGVVLGVIYKDTQKSRGMIAGALAGGTAGAAGGVTLGPGGVVAGGAGGAVAGAVLGSTTVDDVLIVSKKDCGNSGTAKFPGYADGTASSFDATDMRTAFYCGSVLLPGQSMAPRLTDLISPASMWTVDDLTAAFNGDKPITCDFTLTDGNAPSDPGTKLMHGCQKGYCVGSDLNCNEAGVIK